MRATTFSSPKGLALVVLAAALLAWRADPARAQSMFCPQGFYLRAGACTNGQDGAFSTASVGVQALSEFAQATAQQTTAGVGRATAMRREEEQQRCPPGFARRDGACRKIEGPAQTGGDGAAGSRMGQAPVALRGFRAEWPAAGEGLGLQSAIVAEPDARYGGWTQVFGDYELRSASGLGVTACCVGDVAVGGPPLVEQNVKSRASKAGFLAGADVTTRGVIDAGDGAIVGVLTGYVDTQIDLEAQAIAARILGGSSTRLHGTLSGPSAGAYAVYFDGAFSADLALRADALTLSEQVNEILITTVPSVATVIAANSVGLLTDTVAANVNYRLRPAPGYWVEPTIGAQVVGLNYGSNAADLGLQDGRQITAQAGARLGAEARLDARTRVTTTLTGLAYDDVSITGGFTPDFAFLGRNILAQADEGRLRGRGVVNVNFDFDERISTFAQAEVRGGAHLFGVGGKAGVRWIW